MPKPPKRKGNVSKPLSLGATRGLLRALISINKQPIGPQAAQPRRSGTPSRVLTSDEVAALASGILRRAQEGKEVRLSPATAAFVAEALVRMNTAPTHDMIAEVLCISKICAFRQDNRGQFCFQCRLKANAVMSLVRGEREMDAS